MSKGSGRYDPELQMFVDKPREANLATLQFMRWLVEHGKLEHAPLGHASGEYAAAQLTERAVAA